MLDRLLPHAESPRTPSAASAPTDDAPLDWARQRAPLTDQDRVLLSQTHLWLRRIPTPLHPKQLCRYHPRIANRLAQSWDDHEATGRLLDELLIDRRGKRRGFGERITLEIQRLERFHARRPRFERMKTLGERLRDWVRNDDPQR